MCTGVLVELGHATITVLIVFRYYWGGSEGGLHCLLD